MTIKDLEMELGIPRASIRFYERQQLIHPKREENGYRDYSEKDVADLKKIIIFRKLGLSIAEIEDIFDGSVTLSDSIGRNIVELQRQLDELGGAVEVCRQIQKRHEAIETFDEQFYWTEIHRKEKAGNRFMDITSDFIKYEKEDVIETLTAKDSAGNPRHTRGMTTLKTVLLIIACGIIGFLMNDYDITGIMKGAFTPVLFLLIVTIFQIPAYFTKEKSPGTAKYIRRIGYVAATVGMFAYLIQFIVPDILGLIMKYQDAEILPYAGIGLIITIWGYVYHILERRLIFDRRHVTGINGFTVICFSGGITAIAVCSCSPQIGVSYGLLLIIIYQLIDHFVEEKQYSEEERFKKPDV